ncbi:glycoside hydrolase family 3 N-terminal domain-containing protein [Actinomadura kijaniata]|uniref:glycoside hydrolase family 3 N-terminal domain-containing protein n=1 Tax=Actinomadura kijaniata TaxID=46161 RepID=UPI003F1BFF65
MTRSGLTRADDPHGIRQQAPDADDALGPTRSVPATCFPAHGHARLLLGPGPGPPRQGRRGPGPGVDIKRSPLCGRNFEHFSEDPYLTGVMGAGVVSGIQTRGIGACVKHFAVNDQETGRLRVSADADERTLRKLRKLHLPAFEHIVRHARPFMVMSVHNRINGVVVSDRGQRSPPGSTWRCRRPAPTTRSWTPSAPAAWTKRPCAAPPGGCARWPNATTAGASGPTTNRPARRLAPRPCR